MDSLILIDFSLKTIDISTRNTTTIILQHRVDRKIRRARISLTANLTTVSVSMFLWSLEWRNTFIFEQIAKHRLYNYILLWISGEHICRFIYY